MKIYASIDLLEGRCVQLEKGNPKDIRVSLEDPLALAGEWEKKGADGLHIIDLDGAIKGRRSNKDLVRDIVQQAGIPCQVGGGLRNSDDLAEIIGFGAKAIVGTRALDLEFLITECAVLGAENLIVAVDSEGEKIVVKGWMEESERSLYDFTKDIDGLGLGGILYTNVSIEGTMSGIDPKPIKKLKAELKTPLIVAGGIGSYKDLDLLRDLQVDACTLGMALYKGEIELERAKC